MHGPPARALAQPDAATIPRRARRPSPRHARRDPLACLHQLQFWNKRLLVETERRLVAHAELSAVLRIQMCYRGKTPARSIVTAQSRSWHTPVGQWQ